MKQLEKRNQKLETEVNELKIKVLDSNSETTQIEINKDYLKSKAEDAHIFQSSLRKEYENVSQKLENKMKVLKLTKKNLGIEFEHQMKEI